MPVAGWFGKRGSATATLAFASLWAGTLVLWCKRPQGCKFPLLPKVRCVAGHQVISAAVKGEKRYLIFVWICIFLTEITNLFISPLEIYISSLNGFFLFLNF